MAICIEPYRPEHEPAVARFNERARDHGAPFGLSRCATAEWLPKTEGASAFREFFLALEDENVRGGFTLRRQPFWLRGEIVDAANYQGPLSEGSWDRRYMLVGVQMLRAAVRKQPLLYALGMGGMDQPLPRLLAAAGWKMVPVPFRFFIVQPTRFLRGVRVLRQSWWKRQLLNVAAATGVGNFGVHVLQFRGRNGPQSKSCACTEVATFGAWTDEIWMQARNQVAFCAVRDQQVQNATFPPRTHRNLILRCTRAARDIGWAVVRCTSMNDDRYFGDLRVGSIVDALALPHEEINIVAAAVEHLRELGSDLIVSNQTHHGWLSGLRRSGFLRGPSNFIFAASPQLAEKLGPLEHVLASIHFNRADGDGPIHL